jgi:thiol:disulfide interchange protein
VGGLVSFRVHVVGGSGIAVYADYPAGSAEGSEVVGKVKVYRGEFELDVVIEREGEWKGTPLIGVTYQACTETECLRARTVELDVAIDPA